MSGKYLYPGGAMVSGFRKIRPSDGEAANPYFTSSKDRIAERRSNRRVLELTIGPQSTAATSVWFFALIVVVIVAIRIVLSES